MMNAQRGITLIGMLIAGIVIVFVAIAGLKIAPAYIEYFTVKKAIVAVARMLIVRYRACIRAGTPYVIGVAA